MTGSGYLVYVVVDKITHGVKADGTLVTGYGDQFDSPHEAAAALLLAVDNNTGAMASFRCIHQP